MPAEAFAAPRSGFFPSLLKTLNHILVGDTVWMGRLDGAGAPRPSLDQILHTDLAALTARARGHGPTASSHIVDAVAPSSASRRTWCIRTVAGEPSGRRSAQVLAHFFNHQTHHRGQAHAMLSSTEVAPPSLDLIYVSARSSGNCRLAVRVHRSLPPLIRHPGLEPGSIPQSHVRPTNGSRLKAGSS